MFEPVLPLWMMFFWIACGWFCGWFLTWARRPKDTKCPNCGRWIKVKNFHLHWKRCI